MRVAHPVEKPLDLSEFYTLYLADFPVGYSFAGEFHDFWECVYVIRGAIRASADGRICDLPAGSIIFHKPMEIHKFSVIGDEGAELLIVSFSLTGPKAADFCNRVFALPAEAKAEMEAFVQYLQAKEEYHSRPPYKSFLSEQRKTTPNLPLIASYFLRVLLLLAECDRSQSSLPAETPDDAALFSKAVNYIEEHLFRPLSNEEIAKHCNLSLSGLKRLFRKYTDRGVHEYYVNLKFRKAHDLLKSGERVSDVAEHLGFCSQAYFSKAYKRVMGTNPSTVK